jgi:hypothetical protein
MYRGTHLGQLHRSSPWLQLRFTATTVTTHVYTVCGKVRPQLCSNQLPGDCTILFVSPFHAAKLRSAASWAKVGRG